MMRACTRVYVRERIDISNICEHLNPVPIRFKSLKKRELRHLFIYVRQNDRAVKRVYRVACYICTYYLYVIVADAHLRFDTLLRSRYFACCADNFAITGNVVAPVSGYTSIETSCDRHSARRIGA